MPHDDELARRVAHAVDSWPGVESRKMFGGVCWLLHGKMAFGVWRDLLFLRLGEEGATEALGRPHVRPFDVTGRPMKGWVMVGQEALRCAKLRGWLERAREFVDGLPGSSP